MNSTDIDSGGELLRRMYGISPSRGCLPGDDPQTTFRFDSWFVPDFMPIEEIGKNLPTLLRAGTLAEEIERIPILDAKYIAGIPERGAMLLMVRLAFITHAFVWEDWRNKKPRQFIPANLAVPLRALAARFRFCPTLNYSNYALWNWERHCTSCPIAPENLRLIQNFLGGKSEEWFVVIHVAIEHAVAPLFVAAWEMTWALQEKNHSSILAFLKIIASGLRDMNALMRRMPEQCDTEEYFRLVRPYLYGWKDEKIFPNGMLYEGVDRDRYRVYPGETGAQSSIIPVLDRLFGIEHSPSHLSEHLYEMLHVCTQKKQRNFVLSFETKAGLSPETVARYGTEVEEVYFDCRKLLSEFRAIHFYYAIEYIQKQASRIDHPFGNKATGGSPYVDSLWKHLEETLGEHLTKEMGGVKEAFTKLIYPFAL